MRPYTTDTSVEAEAIQLELLRRMSPEDRITKMCKLTASLRRMAFEAIRRLHPDLDEAEVRLKFIESTYGMLNAFRIVTNRHLDGILRTTQVWYNERRGCSSRNHLPPIRDEKATLPIQFSKKQVVL